jgi:hypothetical protein
LAFAVPIYFVASLLAVGVMALLWIGFRFGYDFCVTGSAIPRSEASTAGKLAYVGLAGGIFLIVTSYTVGTIFYFSWEIVGAITNPLGH